MGPGIFRRLTARSAEAQHDPGAFPAMIAARVEPAGGGGLSHSVNVDDHPAILRSLGDKPASLSALASRCRNS